MSVLGSQSPEDGRHVVSPSVFARRIPSLSLRGQDPIVSGRGRGNPTQHRFHKLPVRSPRHTPLQHHNTIPRDEKMKNQAASNPSYIETRGDIKYPGGI
jgi:hypothetical protein